ncbi:hypothetical protein PRIPAC_81589 [Pristionchus pacificus]|uniref:Uncharacterized protein n=1 Tax=Pristionchus pacificus TaxID=54126 RepID=A0A2A6CNM2_PRIPA|nr:hypothetical protein PRIPAC_81589 [Pristionchus pacificus]|eukprot:PDM79710.1 hypothetical protein PRIPAC_32289 [Pristionchus pacificus]
MFDKYTKLDLHEQHMPSWQDHLLNMAAEIAVDPEKLRLAVAFSAITAAATLTAAFWAGQLSAEIFPPRKDRRRKVNQPNDISSQSMLKKKLNTWDENSSLLVG